MAVQKIDIPHSQATPFDQLEHFKLLEEIGSGGMATVYRGEDLRLGREVAIKILHPHLSKSEANKKRFQREAQAVAALEHPNIIQVYHYAKDPVCFIVVEFIHGQDLAEFLLGRVPLFPEVACLVIYQISEALRHAHTGGVLHRDIKPENIIISHTGELKMVDFGIAHIQGLETMTMTGALVGSPAYMAPELLDGKKATFRTDIFSLGVLFYQMLTGNLPFEGDTTVQILKRISEGRYERAERINPKIGPEIAAIVEKMLRLDTTERLSSMSALQQSLTPILQASGISVGQGITEETRKYFLDPDGYSARINQRVIQKLLDSGKKAARANETQTLFNVCERVLALDQGNEEALALVQGARGPGLDIRSIAPLFFAIMLLFALGLWTTRDRWMQGPPIQPAIAQSHADEPAVPIYRKLPEPLASATSPPSESEPTEEARPQSENSDIEENVGMGVITTQPPRIPLQTRAAPPEDAAIAIVAPQAKPPQPPAEKPAIAKPPVKTEKQVKVAPAIQKKKPTHRTPKSALPKKAKEIEKEPAPNPVAPTDTAPGPMGQLKIKVKPVWANLFVDGKDYGQFMMSTTMDLPVGQRHILLENPCCDPVEETLVIKKGGTTIRDFELTIKPAIVQIEVNRPALVYIDDVEMGMVLTSKQFRIEHGSHKITVGAKGYKTQEIIQNFPAGKVTTFPFTLTEGTTP